MGDSPGTLKSRIVFKNQRTGTGDEKQVRRTVALGGGEESCLCRVLRLVALATNNGAPQGSRCMSLER
jgi:hypothetical protein